MIDPMRILAAGHILAATEADACDQPVGIDIIAEGIGSAAIAILRGEAGIEARPHAHEIVAGTGADRIVPENRRQTRYASSNAGLPSHATAPAKIVDRDFDAGQGKNSHFHKIAPERYHFDEKAR